MDARILKLRKLIGMILTAAMIVLLVMMATQITLAKGEDDERPDISIEVVEEIPAADIQEQEVPLADSSQTAKADNVRMTAVAWTLGAVFIAYVVFIISGMRFRKSRRLRQAGTGGDRAGPEGGAR